MPNLFAYGSLMQESVQMAMLGRLLDGTVDRLPGYDPALVPIDDPRVIAETGKTHHANVVVSADADSLVFGMVFDVTEDELRRIDDYEAAFSYRRIPVTLSSGKDAWVYVFTR